MPREENIYENIALEKGISTEEIKTTVGEDKNYHHDNTGLSNRMNCLVYVMLAMLIVLYIAVFIAVGLFAVHTPSAESKYFF